MRLEGRNAVITGAATGIGRATALRFAREGARVVVADIQEDEAQGVVREIEAIGGEALFLRTDVSRREDNERMIEKCVDAYGSIDILFCNAGVFFRGELTESPDDAIDRLIDVNVKAIMYAARSAIPFMLDQGRGNILITASKTGISAQAGSPIYCSTKGAAIQLASALALDYAARGIRVNAICPGLIDTPMLRRASKAEDDPEAAWSKWSTDQPIGRLGTPEECADAALWLASDESSLVTAVALPIDGGFTAM